MTYPTKKKKRKYGDDDDEEYQPPKETKKKKLPKTGKKPLTPSKIASVKTTTKPVVKALVPMTYYTTVPINLVPYEELVAPVYTMFGDPAGCPTTHGDYMGCQQVTMTLGPKQQFLQGGTNATSTHPRALSHARSTYTTRIFKSGHVLNADFGGPDEARNMTVLTSSANTRQTKFDNNVKAARNALYNVYKTIGSCGLIDASFLATTGYGIQLDLQMGGGVWDVNNFPGNCISNQMTLSAVVVNEAPILAAALDPTLFTDPKPSSLAAIPNLCKVVRDAVAVAMTRTLVNNT